MGYWKTILGRKRRPSTQRGSVIIIAVVCLVVISTIALALMDVSSNTYQQARREKRVAELQALADAGAQYGYWKYKYGNITLPYDNTATPQTLGPGSFTVAVTDNSANLSNSIKVVSTGTIYGDTFSVTRIFNTQSTSVAAPTNLTANAGTYSVSLTWTAVSGATSYNIYRGTSSGGESATPVATGVTSATYTDTGLSSSTTYYYEVTALVSGTESGKSNEASATPTTSALNVTFGSMVSSVNLTTEGTLDWSEWGYDARDHKSSGGGLISDLTYSGGPSAYTSTAYYSWTDGSPTAAVSNTRATYYCNSTGASMTVTLPTFATTHTAKVYVAEDNCDADFNVTMSGTGLTYDDKSHLDTSTGHGGHLEGIYTIVYQGNAGGALTVKLSVYKHHGNPSLSQISIQAVTLF